ncbi:hypothetical protein [Dethiobacter alkaliphilus]|uniref:Uncharacterized protein n=1 Tax=Dethiobacter alkaliphilus AHT 1 TaxID=555088 RepID=C0GKG8_DETAL|nr:hypothetical protein [Dethiobacter alkaliphilus]EEG76135.1 hypothetical protein DealDRAFT_2977 [Dethiobacter alkaliphilus AHT 1]
MSNEVRTLVYFIFYASLIGYVFSTLNESYFKSIHMPGWLNRLLFVIRPNKPVVIIAVAWQIVFMVVTITLLMLFRLGIVSELISIIEIYEYIFSFLFLISVLTIGVDKFLYYRRL